MSLGHLKHARWLIVILTCSFGDQGQRAGILRAKCARPLVSKALLGGKTFLLPAVGEQEDWVVARLRTHPTSAATCCRRVFQKSARGRSMKVVDVCVGASDQLP